MTFALQKLTLAADAMMSVCFLLGCSHMTNSLTQSFPSRHPESLDKTLNVNDNITTDSEIGVSLSVISHKTKLKYNKPTTNLDFLDLQKLCFKFANNMIVIRGIDIFVDIFFQM